MIEGTNRKIGSTEETQGRDSTRTAESTAKKVNIHDQIGEDIRQNTINGLNRRHPEIAIGAMTNMTGWTEATNDQEMGIDTKMAMSQGIIEIMMNGGAIMRTEINSKDADMIRMIVFDLKTDKIIIGTGKWMV